MTIIKVKKPRYFYGWNIVAASFLANLSYAEHHSSVLGFFFKPLQNEFGWNRTSLAITQTIARLTEAFLAPIIGPFIDKYGSRVLLSIGAIITGLTMLGITQIHAIWQFYLLRGIVVAIGFTLMGNLVTDVAINNWFIRKRGRAVGIGRLGTSVSNVIFTPVTVFVIAAYGWQTMFVVFAVLTWLVVLIPSIILMRRRPEDMGIFPDGTAMRVVEETVRRQQKNSTEKKALISEPIWNRREVLATTSFWLLSFCFGIDSLCYQGINISLAPYIQDLGYSDVMLSSVMTFRAIIMATSLPLVGLLVERANRTIIRIMPALFECIGAFLFLFAGQPVFLWLAVVFYGLGVQSFVVLQEVIWANYFGRFSLGVVRSLGYLVAFGLGAVGPIIMNAVFDISGSYQPAFIAAIGLFALAALAIAIAPRPKARRYAKEENMTASRRHR